ncbi:hypothetical protein C8A03DRAFT_35284 [Achaetomium macrosporum]|uniref:Uncharacterized protein n=1 Tax=Achaetomium macrosporum TaxID=79813 RepID=A0AAN7HE51_9PEZI|nr:hypothetical protein C8A03DRAFT_35284 [Achaetomium macrosporum]
MGDTSTATTDLQCIRQIVQLRGGLGNFESNEELAAEILRCDPGIAVQSGLPTVFFVHSATPYPNLAVFLDNVNLCFGENHTSRPAFGNPMLGMDPNCEIAMVWTAMTDSCALINYADGSEQRISVRTFVQSIPAIMYRLVSIDHKDSALK